MYSNLYLKLISYPLTSFLMEETNFEVELTILVKHTINSPQNPL